MESFPNCHLSSCTFTINWGAVRGPSPPPGLSSSDPHGSNPLRVIGLIDMDAFYAQVVVPLDCTVTFGLTRSQCEQKRLGIDPGAAMTLMFPYFVALNLLLALPVVVLQWDSLVSVHKSYGSITQVYLDCRQLPCT